MSRRERAYWSCQAAGWSLLCLSYLAMFAAFQRLEWKSVAQNLWIGLTGMGLSHALRRCVKRWGWLRLPLRRLVPRLLVACVSLAMAWVLLALVNACLVLRLFPLAEVRLNVTLVYVLQFAATLLAWSTLYFGWHYLEGYRASEVEAWRLKTAVKEAELRALKAQMDPHFIFNSLNGLRGLITQDAEKARDVVTRLANILRYSLQANGSQTVALESEIQTVSDYLALEAVRLEERLVVRMEIDPHSVQLRVPPLLVQTLVENGIKHGIARLPQGGEIVVRSAAVDGELRLQVINTGALVEGGSEGVGLNNTLERLKLLFGDSATLSLHSLGTGQVEAEVRMPAIGPPA